MCVLVVWYSFTKCKDTPPDEEGYSVRAQTLEKWTETEVLSQKFSAERKWTDSLRCFGVKGDISGQEKQVLFLYWSKHPEVLKQKVDSLINGK